MLPSSLPSYIAFAFCFCYYGMLLHEMSMLLSGLPKGWRSYFLCFSLIRDITQNKHLANTCWIKNRIPAPQIIEARSHKVLKMAATGPSCLIFPSLIPSPAVERLVVDPRLSSTFPSQNPNLAGICTTLGGSADWLAPGDH